MTKIDEVCRLEELHREGPVGELDAVEVGRVDEDEAPTDARIDDQLEGIALRQARQKIGAGVVGMRQGHRSAGGGTQDAGRADVAPSERVEEARLPAPGRAEHDHHEWRAGIPGARAEVVVDVPSQPLRAGRAIGAGCAGDPSLESGAQVAQRIGRRHWHRPEASRWPTAQGLDLCAAGGVEGATQPTTRGGGAGGGGRGGGGGGEARARGGTGDSRYEQELHRGLGVLGNIAITVSAVTPASSVFIIIPFIILTAGTGAFLALVFAAIIGIFMAFCWGELSAAFPIAGGDYALVWHAFKGPWARLGNALSFATFALMLNSVAFIPAVIALGTAQYIQSVVTVDTRIAGAVVCIIAAIVGILRIRTNAIVTGIFLTNDQCSLNSSSSSPLLPCLPALPFWPAPSAGLSVKSAPIACVSNLRQVGVALNLRAGAELRFPATLGDGSSAIG